ncbi:LacI family transcriptional regulator [Halosquirtibacter xylanolyticus]|uniref:LacI family DNA-binding transcriptional regulator n=1 Tax=Halosquirtibacter xylanolyticus TaxID=3374599 RepID=UPI003748F46C|nr:LacI family transcriptional regulator [Prolixibacteraceae bacterium]
MAKHKGHITIHDIAKALNVSASTVSRALKDDKRISEATRKRVIKYAQENGYRPNVVASNLRKQRTETIGVIVPRIDRHFLSTIISSIEQYAHQHGFSVLITQSRESIIAESKAVLTMFNQRVDGLLVSTSLETENELNFDLFIKNNIPLVFFDRVPDNDQLNRVVTNDQESSFKVTRRLLSNGHKKIFFVNGPSNILVFRNRLKGFQQALFEMGSVWDETLYRECDLTRISGRRIAEEILSSNNLPNAIYCSNDTTALSFLQVAQEKGLSVPKDFSLHGFSDEPFSAVLTPKLSSVRQPGEEMGKVAVERLIELIEDDKSIAETVIIPSVIKSRESDIKKTKSRLS